MSLTMVIMAGLAYFYRQVDLINHEVEIQQNRLFKQLYLSTRLTDIIPKALSPNKKKDFFFYVTTAGNAATSDNSPSLVLSYDNGVKLDPRFSNQVLGRLFIDRQQRLCIAVWPSTDRWDEMHRPPMKSEILMENVCSVSYRFYIPPKEGRDQAWKQAKIKAQLPEGFPESSEGIWTSEWPAAWEQLPAMIEMTITLINGKETEKLVFTYPLSNSNFMVVY